MIVVSVLLSLAVPLVVIWLIARFLMGKARAADIPVARTIGAIAHVGVVAAAANAAGDLIEVVVGNPDVYERTTRLVAFDVATLVVAVPVAWALWRSLFAAETDFARRFAIVAGCSVALVTTITAAARVVFQLAAETSINASALGVLIAFGVVWFGYERLRATEAGSFEVDDLRPLAGSALGLGLTAAAMGNLIELGIERVTSPDLLVSNGVSRELWVALALALTGVPTLVWFWFLDLWTRETRFRNGYAAVVSTGSLVAAAGSAASLAFLLLERAFGLEDGNLRPGTIPALITTIIIAGIIWLHHSELLAPRRGLARRFFGYVVAGVGFTVGLGGFVTLVAASIEAVSADTIVRTSNFGSLALGGVIAVVTGAALWWSQWPTGGEVTLDERASAPRRIYLVGLLVLSGAVGGVSLIIALFGLLEAVFEGSVDTSILFDGRFVIALVVAAAPAIWHLLGVLRDDRAHRPAEHPHRPALLVAADAGSFSNNGVRFLHRSDGLGIVTPDIAETIRGVLESPGKPVVIVVGTSGIDVTEVDELT